ncbi:MFS general substrate transporter [Basidiobolus meristosporus CBS 931.73]|uniref:Autophagy-related protein n=1 Tax=Basidiobolus meristosporus CBS 931.73 TaxID=1314790 RepID=A0A1Y1Y6B1_9FUNG|nr:MFS general substrate transporter [Basidiobolus meristosporus CBS 931.73]|eukprot:ORX93246.1 MFS general substrate transporter [Basidiobolus meristosporus CBS 931.73]
MEDPKKVEHFDVELDQAAPLVTQSELRAWYSYSWAIEPFSVSAMSVFIPLILESLAAEAGLQQDLVSPCDTSKPDYVCVVKFGNGYIDTNTYSLYIRSFAVAAQAVVFISCGAIADHGNWRKIMLLFFGILGSISGITMLAAYKPELYWVVALTSSVATICFGASFLFYSAYIPTLTRNHQEVVEARASGDQTEYHEASERIANGISGKSMAWGYLAGVLVLIIGAIIVYFSGSTVFSMQIACAFSSLWWLVFCYPPMKWLKPRPGPPLPKGESYLFYSWKKVFKTLCHIPKLGQIFLFLLCWFFVSDAINTITSVAILFAKTTLGMNYVELLIAGVVVPLCAGVGNMMWLFIQRKLHLSTKKMIIIIISLYILLPVYGLLGFVAPFGLKHKFEAWIVCVWIGLLLGAIQSYCRVMFSELIPKGMENELFSLYQITDKGSAWIGPLITGAITDATKDLRYSFYPLLGMLFFPLLVIFTVNVAKGKAQARQFAGDKPTNTPSFEEQ